MTSLPKNRLRTVALPVVLGLGATSALATVVARRSVPEMVAAADRILEGRVESAVAFEAPIGIVATRVTLTVERGFRNAKEGDTWAFDIPGGEVGDRGLLIPGMPSFEVGEGVLLFLTADTEAGIRLPVGLGQGKYRVVRDPATGEKRLTRSIGAVELLDVKTGRREAAPADERFDYASFTEALEKLVREDDARKSGTPSDPSKRAGGK